MNIWLIFSHKECIKDVFSTWTYHSWIWFVPLSHYEIWFYNLCNWFSSSRMTILLVYAKSDCKTSMKDEICKIICTVAKEMQNIRWVNFIWYKSVIIFLIKRLSLLTYDEFKLWVLCSSLPLLMQEMILSYEERRLKLFG